MADSKFGLALARPNENPVEGWTPSLGLPCTTVSQPESWTVELSTEGSLSFVLLAAADWFIALTGSVDYGICPPAFAARRLRNRIISVPARYDKAAAPSPVMMASANADSPIMPGCTK